MALVHSTPRDNLTPITAGGLRLDRSLIIEGMQGPAIFLFDADDQTATNKYHRAGNVVLEVDTHALDRAFLHEYHTVPLQLRKENAAPDAYIYLQDIPPASIRVFGEEEWGL